MKRSGMKPLVLAGALALALGAGCRGTDTKGQAVELKTEDDKTLYALGLSIGGNLSPLSLSAAEIGVVEAGLRDAASGAKPQVELQVYGPKIAALADARAASKATAEKERANVFLDKQAAEPGAERTSSGLIFVAGEKGSGAAPKAGDTVRVHYRGTLIDGTEFDSSYKRNQPVEFPLDSVIPCWTEGVQKMAVGGKAKLICPSSIAYGDSGRPPVIPPGATLVFEVELLGITTK